MAAVHYGDLFWPDLKAVQRASTPPLQRKQFQNIVQRTWWTEGMMDQIVNPMEKYINELLFHRYLTFIYGFT